MRHSAFRIPQIRSEVVIMMIRFATAVVTCALGLMLSSLLSARHVRPQSTQTAPKVIERSESAKEAAETALLDSASEISLVRVYDGCLGCPDRKLVLRRDASMRFGNATVSETDLHSKKERHGELSGYYFNNLLKLIEAQRYFSLDSDYGMGWFDSLKVKLSVSIGDIHKTIQTGNEGDVPIQLWGIYYAIDGASAKTEWNRK